MFQTNYKVRVDDINYGGHMGNERALVIFQQTRIEWLNLLGLEEKNIGEGKGIIQIESHVYYLKEVRLGEILNCFINEIEANKNMLNIFYKIINSREEIVLKGMTKMMAFDYTNKKLVKFPKNFKEKLTKTI